MKTQEGTKLPVKHCIKDTTGWQICDELKDYAVEVVEKITFGSVDLPKILKDYGEEIEEIELCGLCTDICVISNAMILKASFPEVKIKVDGKCCAEELARDLDEWGGVCLSPMGECRCLGRNQG
jgi:hypothetical protein